MRARYFIASASLVVLIGVAVFYFYGRSIWVPVYQKFAGKTTVAEVVEKYGPSARARLSSYFEAANEEYPPKRVTLLALKDSAELELWVGLAHNPTYIRTYPIKALSGVKGPKLREGDRQVPEGIYSIEYLNPNSSYHLSIKLNFPNAFDLKHAEAEGRTGPGSDIFIHGKAVSIGCLAMGDRAIEELFVLASDIGSKNFKIVIAPSDPRQAKLDATQSPEWVSTLYNQIEAEFRAYERTEI